MSEAIRDGTLLPGPYADGSLFAGRYRILRAIAQGGMGAVYEVLHLETNRRRALKVMHPHIFESKELRERFKREARVTAEIESEHIVDVFDAGIDEFTNTPFMVMELLRGEELGRYSKRLGPLPPTEVLTYLRQAALALDKTHAARIVHRDLKPENLFLTQRDDGSPRIKILDFGVAKVVADGAPGRGTQSLGTPFYMAPEQFRPGAEISPAADIFALALMAYTLLVGDPYWREDSIAAGGLVPFITIAVRGPRGSPTKRAALVGVTLPSTFDEWFFQTTAFTPELRFQSATAAINALEKVFDGTAEPDLGKTKPIVKPMEAEVPAPLPQPLDSTAETFVPTAVPKAVEPSKTEILINDVPMQWRPQRSRIVSGALVTGALAIAIVCWLIASTPELPPAMPSAASAASVATNEVDKDKPEQEDTATRVTAPETEKTITETTQKKEKTATKPTIVPIRSRTLPVAPKPTASVDLFGRK